MENSSPRSQMIIWMLGVLNIALIGTGAWGIYQIQKTTQEQYRVAQNDQREFLTKTMSGYQAFMQQQEEERRSYEQSQKEQIETILKSYNTSDQQVFLTKILKEHQVFLQKQESDRRDYEQKQEYAKVGGKENFDTIQAYQIASLNDQIKSLTPSEEGEASKLNGIVSDGVFEMSESDVRSILAQSTIIKGSSSPDILLVEYLDPECPFCQRQYRDQTIDQLISYNPDLSIGHSVRAVSGANHTNTTTKGYALICADEIAGHTGVREMLNSAFADMTQSTTEMIARTSLSASQMEACLGDPATAKRFADNNSEFAHIDTVRGKQGGGTPTTLLLHTKTGKATLVEGAYPLDRFSEALKQIIR